MLYSMGDMTKVALYTESQAPNGTQKVYPVTTTIFTLMASNGGNTVAQTSTAVVP